MKIIVCIKQVPGTTNVEIDPATGSLKRDGVEAKLNPYDLFAIELALRLREEHGGTVTAVTMGPPQAENAALEAVYMGADDAVVVCGREFAGSDVLATSYALSQAIRSLGAFDIVITGKQTTDGDTAQVGSELAEFLGIPHAANVTEIIAADGASITYKSGLDDLVMTQKTSFPCLLAAESDIVTPRLPSYLRKKAADKSRVRFVGAADFPDKELTRYGSSGSPTHVERIFPPEKNSVKTTVHSAHELAELLRGRKFIG